MFIYGQENSKFVIFYRSGDFWRWQQYRNIKSMWVSACLYVILGPSRIHISWCSAIATIIFAGFHIFSCCRAFWQWKWTTFCRERDLNTRFSVDLVFVALWVKYINSENVLTLWGFILNIMTYRRISVPGFVCSSCCIAVGDCVHYHLL